MSPLLLFPVFSFSFRWGGKTLLLGSFFCEKISVRKTVTLPILPAYNKSQYGKVWCFVEDLNLDVQKVPSGCSTTVKETVCVQADIKITPNVTVGTIRTFCVGRPVFEACSGKPAGECCFTVSQNICVQVPISFDVDVTAESGGLVCGTPSEGTCAPCSE